MSVLCFVLTRCVTSVSGVVYSLRRIIIKRDYIVDEVKVLSAAEALR